MRIDLPLCSFKNCRCCFDGNCNSTVEYERCRIRKALEIDEAIDDAYDLDRLRELVEADKAGRCVVLPCVTGKTAYKITMPVCKWRDSDKCDMYCSGYGDCWEGEKVVEAVQFEPWMIACMGKTVFLTREAAETAIAKEADHE